MRATPRAMRAGLTLLVAMAGVMVRSAAPVSAQFTSPPSVTAATILSGAAREGVALGDLNGDGKPDLVAVKPSTAQVGVSLNTTALGGAPSFGSETLFSTPTTPRDVALADLNRDGKLDLVVVNTGSDSLSVFLNSTAPGATTPTFQSRNDVSTGASSAPLRVAVGNLRDMGLPDLVVTRSGLHDAVVVVNGTSPGAPSFSQSGALVTVALGSQPVPSGVAIGDVTGDGRPDIAVTTRIPSAPDAVSVFRNTTSGVNPAAPSFAAKLDFDVGTDPRGVALGDLNGDGKSDLVVANNSPGTLTVLRNTTTDPLSPNFSGASVTVGSSPVGVAQGDLNGDGKRDILVTQSGVSSLGVLINATAPGAAPSFAAPVSVTTGASPQSVALGDLNGDGLLDAVTGNGTGASVSVLRNGTPLPVGGAAFSGAQDYGAGNRPNTVAADVNGDGKPDLLVANSNFDTVSVLLNTPFGAVRINPATVSLAENSGVVTQVVVERDGTTANGPISVDLGRGGTATQALDYGFGSSLLNWVQGDTSSRFLPWDPINDSLPEGDGTILFTLTSPTSGLVLAGNQTVTLIDDECLGKNIGVSVAPGGPGALTVTISPHAPATITNILFKGAGDPGHITATNATYSISGGPQNQTGNVNFAPPNGANPVIVTLRRTCGSGSATLPFDVTDQCGTQAKFAGGGDAAWPAGVGPSQPRGTLRADSNQLERPGAACATFANHAAAQAHLRKDPSDPLLIDKNRNGIACEGSDGAGFMNPPLDMTPVPRP